MARPPFQFSSRAVRYRDPDSGRWINRDQVRAWLDRYISASQSAIVDASNAFRSGNLSLAGWQAAMRDEIKDAHLVAEALARGGWKQLQAADFGRVGQRVRAQYRFLESFTAQLRRGEVRLDGSFLNRARMYASSARAGFYASQGALLATAGYTHERSLLHPAEHCAGCVAEAERGWVPIGHLVPIGERTCLVNCKCAFEFA
jgi:hypothetical protein